MSEPTVFRGKMKPLCNPSATSCHAPPVNVKIAQPLIAQHWDWLNDATMTSLPGPAKAPHSTWAIGFVVVGSNTLSALAASRAAAFEQSAAAAAGLAENTELETARPTTAAAAPI